MKQFNPLIHQAVRLRIMATVCALESGDFVDFTYLKRTLGLTDGNLGSHLEKLEQANYLNIERARSGRNAKMYLQATSHGKAAYDGHRQALLAVLDHSES